ncbi:MAG TPA: M17 family peptidase N-terminal domain-containing protein [Myxococcales bacterium]|jgi:hypothetical protein
MMDLTFFPLTLEAVDQAAAESLCLFIGEDERPLTGLAGLADWRLSGRLSRLLRSGALTGEDGEAVLTPPGSRLRFTKLFLFGLGKSQDEASLMRRVAEGMRKVAQAGVQEAALQLPARLTPDAGIRALVDEPEAPSRTMVFTPEPQKMMAALSHAASRGKAHLERRVVKVAAPVAKPMSPPHRVLPAVSKQTPHDVPVAPAVPDSVPAPAAVAHPTPRETPPAGSPAAAVNQPEVSEAKLGESAPVGPPDVMTAKLPDAPAMPPESAPQPPNASQLAHHKRPAPPPPPPPPVKRPAPTPPQRYVPQEPSQNVFDKKRKK